MRVEIQERAEWPWNLSVGKPFFLWFEPLLSWCWQTFFSMMNNLILELKWDFSRLATDFYLHVQGLFPTFSWGNTTFILLSSCTNVRINTLCRNVRIHSDMSLSTWTIQNVFEGVHGFTVELSAVSKTFWY